MTVMSATMFSQASILAGMCELILALGLFNSPLAVMIRCVVLALPFQVWLITTFTPDLPLEIEDAAIMDLATPWQVVTLVFLPMMRPAIQATAILAYIEEWNEFRFALTFISSGTMWTARVAFALLPGIASHVIPWGQLTAALMIVSVPLVGLVLMVQRKIATGLTAGGVR